MARVSTERTNASISRDDVSRTKRICTHTGSPMHSTKRFRFRVCWVTIHQTNESAFLQNISCGQNLSTFVPQSSSRERQRRQDRLSIRQRSWGTGRSSQITVCKRDQKARCEKLVYEPAATQPSLVVASRNRRSSSSGFVSLSPTQPGSQLSASNSTNDTPSALDSRKPTVLFPDELFPNT